MSQCLLASIRIGEGRAALPLGLGLKPGEGGQRLSHQDQIGRVEAACYIHGVALHLRVVAGPNAHDADQFPCEPGQLNTGVS